VFTSDEIISPPSLAFRVETCIYYQEQNSKAAKVKRISTFNVPEDENNLVQTSLGGEFWASDVTMHQAHCNVPLHLDLINDLPQQSLCTKFTPGAPFSVKEASAA